MGGATSFECSIRVRGTRLVVAGLLAFAVSLFLPYVRVFVWVPGRDCVCEVVCSLLAFFHGEDYLGPVTTASAVTNALFGVSPVLLWMARRSRLALRRFGLLYALAGVHSLSLLYFLNLRLTDIGPGFYVWVLSYLVMSAGALHLGAAVPMEQAAPARTGRIESEAEIRARQELDGYLNGVGHESGARAVNVRAGAPVVAESEVLEDSLGA
jgi:hypothetical protein